MRRPVVADDVVLGGHGEVDPGRDEREHAVFRRDGGVEARTRVDVQVAPEHAGRRDDVARRELAPARVRPGAMSTTLASMLHSMPLVAATR